MASPNASLALRLQQSKTYEVLEPTYRQGWIQYCLQRREVELVQPVDGESFGDCPKSDILNTVKDRLNNSYGMAAGCFFACKKNRLSSAIPTLEFWCYFYGDSKSNNWKIKSTEVEKDDAG